MKIKSSIRNYECIFKKVEKSHLEMCDFFLIDSNVFSLYPNLFLTIKKEKIVIIEALEKNKEYIACQFIIEQLIIKGIKRGQVIGCVGGGILQDITGFVSSILYRGIDWYFFPTTLLAQADSCIGGKTSINFKKYKNLIGNFNPPKKVIIDNNFLKTLPKNQLYSGLGEIVKVYFLDEEVKYDLNDLTKQVKNINTDMTVENELIKNALAIKKRIIEIDEFDKGLRNVMNYGHTFGHAIESITNFKIDHGIAVLIGMYIANEISKNIFNINVKEMQNVLKYILGNCKKEIEYLVKYFNVISFINALKKDKKNTSRNEITCILTNKRGKMFKKSINALELKKIIKENFKNWMEDVNKF